MPTHGISRTHPTTKQEELMPLTVTEKEHWKDRISRRIDKRIEAIHAEGPNLKDRIQRDARQRALESLGLAEMQTERDEIAKQKEALEKRERKIRRQMLAHVRGVPVDDVDDVHPYGCNAEVNGAINRRQDVCEDELLAECDRGKQILRLREEKENLLDTVWLATSSTQVKELWGKVTELLGSQPTQLESDALGIVPADGEVGG